MQTQLEATRSLDYAELRKLADVEGPCITVSMPLQSGAQQSRADFQRLKSAIREADHKLSEGWPDLPAGNRRGLLESLQLVESEIESWNGQGGSLVVLRSSGVFRAFEVEQDLDETVVVGDFFHIYPFLQALQVSDQLFYVLGLSLNDVRLLKCTRKSSERVALAAGTPSGLEEWLNTGTNASDNQGEKAPATGPSGSFTSATDIDKKDQHVANFFHVINKAVTEVLSGQPHPLVLCGVDEQRSIYSSINTYPHLWAEGVHGSPESLKGSELHARALQVVQDFYSVPSDKALEQWERIGGTARAITSFPDIVKASFEARVAHLFAKEDAHTMGVFDRGMMQMRVQGRQEDLVNAAALQTLAFGGDVFIMSPEDVPGKQQLAAILRY
ncbi:MAG: hypothetical protein H7Y20_16435 [Bryobacteraceae bacterium]|nr:hypothetical protein [Bryobacteraceae bacterium]